MSENIPRQPGMHIKIANRTLLQEQRSAVLSANILLTYLHAFDILSKPQASSKRFRYCLEVFGADELESLEEIDPACLYICSTKTAPALLDKSPMVFLLVITRDDEVPSYIKSNRPRVILLRSDDRLFYIGSIVQNLFTSLIVWENNLDRIVTKHGTLAELLNEGGKVLNNFIWISDDGFNIVAHTEDVQAPDEKLAAMIRHGCYSEEGIQVLEGDIDLQPEDDRVAGRPHDTAPAPRLLKQDPLGTAIWDNSRIISDSTVLHLPIFFEGMPYFHLAMACTSGMELSGAYDFFMIFAERVVALCGTLWERIIDVESPWYRVLTGLIEQTPMKPQYVEAQLALTALPQATQVRLVCIGIGANTDTATKHKVINAARKLNGGECYPFAYDNSLLVLCYTKTNDLARFSVDTAVEELQESICDPHGVTACVSRVFSKLENIHLSYQETRIAHNFSKYIDREQQIVAGEGCHGVFLFEAAAPFYMAARLYLRDDVVAESLKENPVRTLAEEDREMGTNIVELLWIYLAMERNATAVSKRLHMHRNTVLYHIDKIKKRFDIDLDVYIHRTALLDCFRVLLLTDGYRKDIPADELFTITKREAQHPIK